MATQEQWEIKRFDNGIFIKPVNSAVYVATINEANKNAEVNANLIAAAPELLEALMFIVNNAEPGEDAVLSTDAYNKACKAIAKVEGRL
jgi:hypothetical protein